MTGTNPTYEIVPAENDDAVEHVYDHLKSFWFERHQMEVPAAELEELLETHRKGFFQSHRVPVANLLKSFCREKGMESRLSFIELGGANGSTLHYLSSFINLEQIDYVNVEPYGPFRDDLSNHFPDHHAAEGNAESFVEMDFSQWVRPPVSAVVAFGVLCMTPGRVVENFFRRASELSDDIIGFDYCIDFDGQLPENNPWLFWYNPETGQLYFIHNFGKYAEAIGFDVVRREPLENPDGKIGWEVFHLRRKR